MGVDFDFSQLMRINKLTASQYQQPPNEFDDLTQSIQGPNIEQLLQILNLIGHRFDDRNNPIAVMITLGENRRLFLTFAPLNQQDEAGRRNEIPGINNQRLIIQDTQQQMDQNNERFIRLPQLPRLIQMPRMPRLPNLQLPTNLITQHNRPREQQGEQRQIGRDLFTQLLVARRQPQVEIGQIQIEGQQQLEIRQFQAPEQIRPIPSRRQGIIRDINQIQQSQYQNRLPEQQQGHIQVKQRQNQYLQQTCVNRNEQTIVRINPSESFLVDRQLKSQKQQIRRSCWQSLTHSIGNFFGAIF